MGNKPFHGDKDNKTPASSDTSSLPYEILPGDGLNSFELLCFRVLMAEKKNPHFYGRKGQEDYGVDIIVEKKDGSTVYSAKT